MNRAPPAIVNDTLGDMLVMWSIFAGSFGIMLVATVGVLAGG